MLKNINIDLIYQPLINEPPLTVDQLHANSCAADGATIEHWEQTWYKNIRANKERLGSFADYSIGKLFNKNKYKPAIVIGSGPSLGESLEGLKLNQSLQEPLLTVSCLHNFGYLLDNGIKADYYLSLDAGEIVLSDVYEGREHPPEHYWEQTAGSTLLAYTGSDPRLLENWKGPIYVFNSLIPSQRVRDAVDAIEKFTHYVSSGGNALGACMYVAKAIMGSPTIMYVGADFCFSYENKFHSYSTHYDNLGHYVMHPDVFGMPRKTWQSYLNFKYWFDKIAMVVPGEWINCSYGLLGSYLGGNIRHFKYMPLETAIVPYKNAEYVNIVKDETKSKLDLAEFFGDTAYSENIVLF